MVTIMDIPTGKTIREPAPYDDQVLEAGWLPLPETRPQLQEVEAAAKQAPTDTEAFLAAYYRSQE